MYLHKTDALNKLKSYHQNLIEEELSENTIERYLFDTFNWLKFMPEIIRKEDLIDYKEELKEIYKLSTVNIKINSINKYLSYLKLDEYKLKTEKRINKIDIDNVLSKNDYLILLEYCRQNKKLKMFYLMKCLASTGIRISELKYITLENIRRGSAIVYNKKRERKIYFSDTLQKLLEDYCELANISSGVIFRGRGSEAITKSTINKNLKTLAIKAGVRLDRVYPHAFRHLFAKEFMKVNGNIFELADILGHAYIETTRVYTKSTGEEKRMDLDKLDI